MTVVWALMYLVNQQGYLSFLTSFFAIAMFVLAFFTVYLTAVKRWSTQKYYMRLRMVKRMTPEQVAFEKERMQAVIEANDKLALSRKLRQRNK